MGPLLWCPAVKALDSRPIWGFFWASGKSDDGDGVLSGTRKIAARI